MPTKPTKPQKPSTPPLSDVGATVLWSLRRYGGRPDLLLKKYPQLRRRPMPDPGIKRPTEAAEPRPGRTTRC